MPEFMQSRPKTLSEFRKHLERSAKDPLPILAMQPRDIVIATFPKCGTTWVQQIVHGLRTHGSMDFEEISLVIPWIERAPLLGLDVNAPQVAEPRAFKTHLPWDLVPKGARYLCVLRDPADALLSFYKFMNGVMFERDCVDVEGFYTTMFARHPLYGTYCSHVRSWWEQRHRENVELLCFEDMQRDHEPSVRRIAAFMGISANEELVALATRQSAFAFMRAHERHFDDAPTVSAICRRDGLPPARTTKVRSGRVGDGASLPSSVRDALGKVWEREIEAPLGFRSYGALRACLSAELATSKTNLAPADVARTRAASN